MMFKCADYLDYRDDPRDTGVPVDRTGRTGPGPGGGGCPARAGKPAIGGGGRRGYPFPRPGAGRPGGTGQRPVPEPRGGRSRAGPEAGIDVAAPRRAVNGIAARMTCGVSSPRCRVAVGGRAPTGPAGRRGREPAWDFRHRTGDRGMAPGCARRRPARDPRRNRAPIRTARARIGRGRRTGDIFAAPSAPSSPAGESPGRRRAVGGPLSRPCGPKGAARRLVPPSGSCPTPRHGSPGRTAGPAPMPGTAGTTSRTSPWPRNPAGRPGNRVRPDVP